MNIPQEMRRRGRHKARTREGNNNAHGRRCASRARHTRWELGRFSILRGSQNIPLVLVFTTTHARNTPISSTETLCVRLLPHGTPWQQQRDRGPKRETKYATTSWNRVQNTAFTTKQETGELVFSLFPVFFSMGLHARAARKQSRNNKSSRSCVQKEMLVIVGIHLSAPFIKKEIANLLGKTCDLKHTEKAGSESKKRKNSEKRLCTFTMMLLEETLSILSLGLLCEEMGYSYEGTGIVSIVDQSWNSDKVQV